MEWAAPIGAQWLGRIGYREAWALQKELVAARAAAEIGDRLLLLEHDPVLTLGRQADESHVLATPRQLSRRGIEVIRVERGGEVTYHGPGQLVAYPIMEVERVADFVHTMEGAIVAALGDEGIAVWDGDFYATGLIERLGLAPAGVVRIGLTHYNTTAEIDRLLEALARIAAEGGPAR